MFFDALHYFDISESSKSRNILSLDVCQSSIILLGLKSFLLVYTFNIIINSLISPSVIACTPWVWCRVAREVRVCFVNNRYVTPVLIRNLILEFVE